MYLGLSQRIGKGLLLFDPKEILGKCITDGNGNAMCSLFLPL